MASHPPPDVGSIATDPDAFEVFYREHLETVQRFVARRVADPQLAADLTAEVFLDSPDRRFEEPRDLHLVDLHMLVMFGAQERTSAEYDALLLAGGFGPGALATTRHGWDVIEAQPVP